ncbi:hypothetical protein O5D80_006137 [Batrachochytrium dendrobatidis]|nr:hypothetical protein O5D80_006137 [Batrachochytrium dendrobatidis]
MRNNLVFDVMLLFTVVFTYNGMMNKDAKVHNKQSDSWNDNLHQSICDFRIQRRVCRVQFLHCNNRHHIQCLFEAWQLRLFGDVGGLSTGLSDMSIHRSCLAYHNNNLLLLLIEYRTSFIWSNDSCSLNLMLVLF